MALLMGGWREDLEQFKTDLIGELQALGRHYVSVGYGPLTAPLSWRYTGFSFYEEVSSCLFSN